MSPQSYAHVYVHTCKHGPTRTHLPDSREPQNMWDRGERVQVQECPAPRPHPPGKDTGSPAKAPGPQNQARAQPRAGRKQDAAQEG